MTPEENLSTLRAKQILGENIDIVEYNNLKLEVIKNSDSYTQKIWNKLESEYDVEVCELIYNKKSKDFGFKIRTPIGTFLNYGLPIKYVFKYLEDNGLKIQNENI